MHRNPALLRLMPWLFVLIWSTGFVVARYAMPHAPPMSFLSLRFVLSLVCFMAWITLARAPWPTDRTQWWHLAVSGVLMHAGYLGGVWAAVKQGIGAGTVALLVGLQPVLTAVWLSATTAGAAGRVSASMGQWVGLLLGLAGLALVVGPKLGAGEVTPLNLLLGVLALVSITVGTLYQKYHVAPTDVRTASTIQLLAALLVSLPFAGLEIEAVHWHAHLVGALVWSVLVLTLGGSSLLYVLIQRGAATRVTSLLYLVPPCTACLAWWLFGEPVSAAMFVGMLLTIGGVVLVLNSPQATQ